ncbi:helix-turn-helix domain-containing protein [Prevotella herbatica]|nr:AraC family transcriptional regulator [Prevotella herbatica]
MEKILYIKNMVCDRCKMAVRKIMTDNGLHITDLELGVVKLNDVIDETMLNKLRNELDTLGFELLDDHRQQTIGKVKSAIIKLVHYHDSKSTQTISDYLSSQLNSDYSALSKLFSEVTGITIERYYIEQRIERVKELIRYDELSLTQISLKMNYSSVAYLSSQFKSVTGMTPTEFKTLGKNNRRNLDSI